MNTESLGVSKYPGYRPMVNTRPENRPGLGVQSSIYGGYEHRREGDPRGNQRKSSEPLSRKVQSPNSGPRVTYSRPVEQIIPRAGYRERSEYTPSTDLGTFVEISRGAPGEKWGPLIEGKIAESRRHPEENSLQSASQEDPYPPPVYDGNMEWQHFYLKFVTYTERRGWDPQECLKQLLLSLDGLPAEFATHIRSRSPGIDYTELVRRLEKRFMEGHFNGSNTSLGAPVNQVT